MEPFAAVGNCAFVTGAVSANVVADVPTRGTVTLEAMVFVPILKFVAAPLIPVPNALMTLPVTETSDPA
jgi:hypothetical protein